MPATFSRIIGIDYSGAKTPTNGLRGLSIYIAEDGKAPKEKQPPQSSNSKYWTRNGIAHWLVDILKEPRRTLVGIDHGFSFPREYFDKYGLKSDWPSFLDDFQRHWPTNKDHIKVDTVRKGELGNGIERTGNTRWRRLTEKRAGGAKSVFHFDVPGQVAKSTHAGIPWLRFIRCELGKRIHFWPFDGWKIPSGKSAIAEVYPALWSDCFNPDNRTGDQHDAYSIAAWLSQAERKGHLEKFLSPDLSLSDRKLAKFEGWILGVPREVQI